MPADHTSQGIVSPCFGATENPAKRGNATRVPFDSLQTSSSKIRLAFLSLLQIADN